MIGETVGNFEIVARLGQGGMGEVWLAEQKNIKTKVAVKFLHAEISQDKTHVQRFFNEAIAVSKIHHAGIVRIFDVGFHAGNQAYLVMEFLEGETLATRIRRQAILAIAEVASIGGQIANVLEATHAAGVTHRDLKPDNIFLVADAELATGERVKVLDFGIAKLGDSVGITASAPNAMGTPLYMSPEQWKNPSKADARSDAYSLGCVMFEMACGRAPFQASSIGEACSKHLTQSPPVPNTLVKGLPVEFDDLILRLLKKKPASRPSMREVAQVLTTLAEAAPARVESSPRVELTTGPVDPTATTIDTGRGSSAQRISAKPTPTPTHRPVRRAPVVLGLGVAGAATVGIVLARGLASEPLVVPVDAAIAVAPPDAAIAPPLADTRPMVSSTKLVRTRGAQPQLRQSAMITLCIDDAGAVTSVRAADDLAADVARELQAKVASWRFAPYRRDGKPLAACSMMMIPARSVAAATAPVVVEDRDRPPAEPPEQAAITAGLAPVRLSIDRCGKQHGGTGTLKLTFRIASDGHVASIAADTPNGALASCLAGVIKSARFAPTKQGIVASYPVTFH